VGCAHWSALAGSFLCVVCGGGGWGGGGGGGGGGGEGGGGGGGGGKKGGGGGGGRRGEGRVSLTFLPKLDPAITENDGS